MEDEKTKWRKAVFTYEDSPAGPLYYFAMPVRPPGPYLEQRIVDAIIDIAADGSLAGIELIDRMPALSTSESTKK